MGWFAKTIDTAIAAVSPSWGMRRAVARHAIRSYDAAKSSRIRRAINALDKSGAAEASAGAPAIRKYARHADRNSDLAIGVLNTLVDHTVGSGIFVEPMARLNDGSLAEDFNRQLSTLWADYSQSPEVTGEYDGGSMDRLMARSWFRDGEVFAQLITGNRSDLDHLTAVPFSVEMLEADYVPFGYTINSDGVIDGIRRNSWGRPVEFFVYKDHPGDTTYIPRSSDVKRIAANNMAHLKWCQRIRQGRGVSLLAGVMTRLEDIKDYEESERVAARVAAAMTMYVKKQGGDFNLAANTTTADGEREFDISPGMIIDNLQPGEDIGLIDPNRPNTNLEAFRNGQLRAVAAGTGTTYSTIAKDFNGTYSAQRQEMQESINPYTALRKQFVRQFKGREYRGFVDAAITSGAIRLPRNIDALTITDADYRGQSVPWIDPLKEAKAEESLIASGLKSRAQSIREHGGDPRTVRAEIVAERQKDQDDGLVFESLNPFPTNQDTGV